MAGSGNNRPGIITQHPLPETKFRRHHRSSSEFCEAPVQFKSDRRRSVVRILCLLLTGFGAGCSSPAPTAQMAPSVAPPSAPTPTLNECELAAQDKTQSTAVALQKCVDLFHRVANQSPLIAMPKMLEGGKVESLGQNKFAVTLMHQDALMTGQRLMPGLDRPDRLEISLNAEIFDSISRLADDAELLFTLFGERGLTRIDATLYTDGLRDDQGVRELPATQPGKPIVLLPESYRVQVKLADLPKIKAWRNSKSRFNGNPAEDPALKGIWKVELNRYPDYKFSSSPDRRL
jgi:hypothetical protein